MREISEASKNSFCEITSSNVKEVMLYTDLRKSEQWRASLIKELLEVRQGRMEIPLDSKGFLSSLISIGGVFFVPRQTSVVLHRNQHKIIT